MSDFNINEDAQSGGEYSGSQSSDHVNSSQPNESAFPDEEEDTITMLDVIEREDKLEEEASAVLGNSDEKNCTYPKGYIARQALYSCATCYEENGTHAAICLACSLECHDNHELYELYTKRNYRCDCGNSKFKSNFECKFVDKHQKKLPINEGNKYNHNFVGKYCICDKRYPPDEHDDSPESNDEMWQCINCEDWYHSKHLKVKELPKKFDELICGPCVEKLDFVHYYRGIKIGDEEEEEEVDEETTSLNRDSTKRDLELTKKIPETTKDQQVDTTGASTSTGTSSDVAAPKLNCESDTNDSQAENKDPINATNGVVTTSKYECLLDELKKSFITSQTEDVKGVSTTLEPPKGAIFWLNCDWRSKLCRCSKCMELYKAKECEYLLDDKDTVQFYEAQGKAIAKNSQSPYERGMSALNTMNRAAVVEALNGYDELKADLSDYLRKFADSKKVVREEDIHEFFSQLKSKKRPRLEYED